MKAQVSGTMVITLIAKAQLCLKMLISLIFIILLYISPHVAIAIEPTAELIYEYRFDELTYDATPGEIIDSTASAFNGQSANGVLSQEAQMCSGAAFDGVDDHVVLPPMSTDFSAGFTVMAWVDFGQPSNWERIVDFGNGAGIDNIVFARKGSSNDLSLVINGCGDITAPSSIIAGRHHYAVTVSAAREAVIFRDGVAIQSDTLSCMPANVQRNVNYIGRSNWSFDGYFDSEMDELKIYTGSLSPEYVTQVFNNESAGKNADGSERVCPVPLPVAEYRFDELYYEDIDDEIIDTVGNFHGRAKDAQPAPGKMCNALDLSAPGITNYAILDENSLHAKTDFSISYWAKTSKTEDQSVISGANAATITANELLLLAQSNSTRFDISGTSNSISTVNTADNQWHHIVWTRAGSQNCLYIDGALQGCLTLSQNVLDIRGLVLGQEQDDILGGFASDQAFDGLIDELLIFDEVIDAAQIALIFNEQNAQTNFDGSPRTCPVPPTPVAEYRFDALSWDGVTSDVLDNSGNNLHGIASNAQPVTGMLCNAADFDRSNMITVPSDALLEVGNNNEDYTVNFWVNYRDIHSNYSNIVHKGGTNAQRTFAAWFSPNNTTVNQQTSTTTSNFNVGNMPSIGITLNTWVMVTLIKDGNQLKTYFNGSLEGRTILSEPTISNSGPLYIGKDPWHDGINGLIDELLIYRSALSDFQVQALYNNNLQGKGWDGETRACQAQVVAGRVTLNNTANTANFTQVCFERPFDDIPSVFSLPTTASDEDRLALRIRNVTRTGFEIAQVESRENANPNPPAGNVSQTVDFLAIEQGDFDLDGGAKLRVATIDTTAYRGSGVTGNSTELITISDMDLGQVPAVIGSIQTMNNETNPFPISTPFMATSIENTTDVGFNIALERAQTYSGDIINTETIAYMAITPGMSGQLTRNITYESFITPNNIRGVNTCPTFGLGASYGATTPLIFANRNTRNGGDGGWLKRCFISSSAVGFSVVEDMDRDQDGAHTNEKAGGIALGGTFSDQTCAVQPPFVYHYQIIHDGQGLTCDTESITINACTNQTCTSLSAQPVSLDFMVNGVVVSTPSFVGSTTIQVSNTDAETVLFSVANPSITPASNAVCSDGTGDSCSMVFTNAGFRFLYGAGTTIANQTAGLAFADTLKLQAVKDSNGVCTGVFSSDTAVELSQENVNPSGASGLSFTTGGAAIAKHPSITATTLTFGANSIATIPAPIYHDAGQIRLHADYNVGGVELSGSSNAFWVAPALLELSAQAGGNNLNGASAISSVTHPAGEDFGLSITAFNGANPRAITQNYVPGNMQMKVTRTAPTVAGSVDGTFKYGLFGSRVSSPTATFEDVSLIGFMAGMYGSANAQYSEVGLVNLDIQDNNYGDGIIIAAADINIGRFVPQYFTQSMASQGGLLATCGTNIAFNAYSGQQDENNSSRGAITYSMPPVFAITAYNKQGVVTQNYFQDSQGSSNDFMRLDNDDISIISPTNDKSAVGIDSTLLPITANISPGVLSQNDLTQIGGVALPRGTLHYALADTDNFVYTRSANAKVAPFVSDIDFVVSGITDADNVSAINTASASPTGIDIRFGRMRLENSFGPETEGLAQDLKLEHYIGGADVSGAGGNFVTTFDNSCVRYDASNIALTNMGLDPSLSAVNSVIGRFTKGQTRAIKLASPGAGNQGVIGVSYDTYDWLRYDWDNNGSLTKDPTATATFGMYRGDDRLLHWREVFD